MSDMWKCSLVLFVLFSCAPIEDPRNTQNIPITFSSYEEAWEWIDRNIFYVDDSSIYKKDEWKTPEETYDSRIGDCEDYALLYAYFLYEMGYDPYIVCIRMGNIYHAIVRIGDIYMESQTYNAFYSKEDIVIDEEWSYKDFLRLSYTWNSR